MTEQITTFCTNHPTVATTLRCNRCEKYICVKCAQRTPTGYRCRECVKGQQKIFITAEWYDYILGFVVASVLSGISSAIVALIGSIGLWGLFIMAAAAPTAGVVIAEACRFVTRRHRATALNYTIVAGIIIGAVPLILTDIMILDFFGLLFAGAYLALVVPTVLYRLSGIQILK